MKVSFVALSAPGHLNPMTALARQFQSRGHDVVLISLPDAEPRASAADLVFIPYGENAFSADFRNEFRSRMSKLQGEEAVDSRSIGIIPPRPFRSSLGSLKPRRNLILRILTGRHNFTIPAHSTMAPDERKSISHGSD